MHDGTVINRGLKVLHVISGLHAGGAELHLLTLCHHLKRFGVEPSVAYLRDRLSDARFLRTSFEQQGIVVHPLEADSWYDVRSGRRLKRVLKNEKPTLLHSHLPRADLAAAYQTLFRPSVPWISSIHDVYSKSWSANWSLPLLDRAWSKANQIVAISEAVRTWLVEGRGLPRNKVRVIQYGIDTEPFVEPTRDLRELWDLKERPVIGSIGRLEPRKGHECLIRAMPLVREEMPSAMLLIAGHDTSGYSSRLTSLVEELNLQDCIRLVGFQADVPSFIHTLDVFAFASHSEGFGQVVVEAMAAGKAPVVSDIPPLNDIVQGGKSGILASVDSYKSFADAILWLLRHPQKAQAMGSNARERVASCYSAKRMATETLSLYGELTRAAARCNTTNH